jgi:hypothetical protein
MISRFASVAIFESQVPLDRASTLNGLGCQFDEVASKFDLALNGGKDISRDLLEAFENIVETINRLPATTIDGLRVKARVAAWALLGDLSTRQNCKLAEDMAMSIVRDLIRHFDRQCERPGAVARLVESATS